MGTIIVATNILGTASTEVLRREINKICIEENIDGDEVWKKVQAAQNLENIKKVLKEYFENKLILV